MHAVVKTLDVDPDKAIKIRFDGALNCSDVRYPGIIHKDVNPLATEYFRKRGPYVRLICHIANVNGRTVPSNLHSCRFRRLLV